MEGERLSMSYSRLVHRMILTVLCCLVLVSLILWRALVEHERGRERALWREQTVQSLNSKGR